jgi:hypothetical protein
VTSNLDFKSQSADHRQGGGGRRQIRARGYKSFVFNILTSNPLGLKILQTIFANPALVKAFRGVEEGGYLSTSTLLPKITLTKKHPFRDIPNFFSR